MSRGLLPPPEPAALRAHLEVLACLLDGRADEAAALLRSAGPLPASFLRFVARNYLGGHLVPLLDAPALRSAFPAPELARVRDAVERRRTIQAAMRDEVADLWRHLRARDVDAVLLKGLYLAERFSPHRTFADLDLLIRPSRLTDLESVFAGLGFRRLSRVPLSRTLAVRFTHGFDFARDRLRVDVHWALGTHPSYRIDYDDVWRDRRSFRLSSGAEVAVLSDERGLFFQLLTAFEDLDRGALRVRSFVDIDAMLGSLDSAIDWPAFWKRRRAEHTARACRAVLALFLVVFSRTERHPHAAASVAEDVARTRALPWPALAALVQSPKGALRNKLWGVHGYECSVPRAILWWAVSLPFRVAVYRRSPGR